MRYDFEPIEGHVWPLVRATFEDGTRAIYAPPAADLGGPASEQTSFPAATVLGPPDREPTSSADVTGLAVDRYEGEQFIAQQWYARRLD